MSYKNRFKITNSIQQNIYFRTEQNHKHMNSIAKKIIETRKTKGLTQEELAEQSKINLRTIQRIENSESEPRGTTLKLICNVLEMDLQDLISNQPSFKTSSFTTQIVNGLFLLVLNSILMGIIGFLTLGSRGSINSVVGGYLLSFFLPFFIVFMTKKMTGMERMLKFGFGYFLYFILAMLKIGFREGLVSGLFPCLLISLSVLYFGNKIIERRESEYV